MSDMIFMPSDEATWVPAGTVNGVAPIDPVV